MAGEAPVALLPINVWLAGRSYRIRIPASAEAAVRRAVKEADQKIIELRQHYAGRDDQDFLAMALLMYATAEADSGEASKDFRNAEIEALIRRIDHALEKDI